MKKYLLVVLLILLGNYGFTEETIEKLYQKAENLYNQIEDKTPSIKNIPKYKEISEILEEIINKNPQDKELLKKTYQLLIISYDNQARYQEKYQTMKKYAQLLYPEDQEKQATYLKEQADKLKEQGEIGEAIMIYRFLIKDYPETKITADCYFQLGKIFEIQGDVKKAIEFYSLVLKEPILTNELKSKTFLSLGGLYITLNNLSEAINTLHNCLSSCSDNSIKEEALYYLATSYYRKKQKDKAKELFIQYCQEYPQGRYIHEVKVFLTYLQNGGSQ